ncbi:MAG: hypothetical protein H0U36_02145 [Nocardioidaceae bacterium]|nr:hypothetical protein [Nocardioidaceae bacterium]
MTATPGTTRYRWPRPLVLRLVGMGLALLGAAWVVGAAVDKLSGGGLGSTVPPLALVMTVVVLGAAAWLVSRPPMVLELSVGGYRLHHLRGGGVSSAGWRDVESAQTQDTADGPALVITLSDGRRSVVPRALLGGRAEEAAGEVRGRLDAAHGYRPL